MRPGAGRLIVDGTLGGGGHSEGLLEAGATVVGFDKDARALAAASARLARFEGRFRTAQLDFGDGHAWLTRQGLLPIDGLLLDLGVSSPQLDDPGRGFSFQKDGPLDMRMGDVGLTAAELIASSDEVELANLIFAYGDERFSRPIARGLKAALPQTTLEAARVIEKAVPRRAWPPRIHVATRTFQALRIAVNRELDALDAALAWAPQALKPGGVFAVISFHSLEDRKVKEAFRALEGQCICPPGLPVCACGKRTDYRLVTKKAIQASDEETQQNPRARSARLRALERLS